MSMLLSLKGTKGKFCDGFRYLKHKATCFKTWWRCEFASVGCKGWGFEREGQFIQTRAHCHPEDPFLQKIQREIENDIAANRSGSSL